MTVVVVLTSLVKRWRRFAKLRHTPLHHISHSVVRRGAEFPLLTYVQPKLTRLLISQGILYLVYSVCSSFIYVVTLIIIMTRSVESSLWQCFVVVVMGGLWVFRILTMGQVLNVIEIIPILSTCCLSHFLLNLLKVIYWGCKVAVGGKSIRGWNESSEL